MAIVELRNVSKIYQMEKVAVKAVDNVSFSIEAGNFCAISGPSGSGKSTLLNLIGLTDLPSAGSECNIPDCIFEFLTLKFVLKGVVIGKQGDIERQREINDREKQELR